MRKEILMIITAILAYGAVAGGEGQVGVSILFEDVRPPWVWPLQPNGTNTTTGSTVNIAARVVDDAALDTVLAQVELPDGTTQAIVLASNGTAHVYAQNITASILGRYNITFLANDTSNNLNNTEATYFVVLSNDIIIRLDGIQADPGDNFNLAGKPTRVGVAGNLPLGGTIEAIEETGYTLTIPAQNSRSKVSPRSITRTRITGNTDFTLIPTGGNTALESAHGQYKITIRVLSSTGNEVYSQTFGVSQRALTSPTGPVNVPSRGDVAFNAQNLFSAFSNAQAWLNNGGGVVKSITIDESTVTGDTNVAAGQPTGLVMKVLQDGAPARNAKINITETNGYVMFGLPQYTDSSMRSISVGTTTTNSTGHALATIIPTAGPSGHEGQIGPYSIAISVVNNTGTLINNFDLGVNRQLQGVNQAGETVPNQGDVALEAQNLFSVFTYVQAWLNQ